MRIKAGGITQAEAAVKAGVSLVTYNKWETGKRCPTVKQLAKLAQSYGCHISDLIDGEVS